MITDDQIKTLIENQRYTTRELAEILKISKTAIHEHLVKLGYVNRYDVNRAISHNSNFYVLYICKIC